MVFSSVRHAFDKPPAGVLVTSALKDLGVPGTIVHVQSRAAAPRARRRRRPGDP